MTAGTDSFSEDEYLARVKDQLRGLSAAEQADVLEEIASHLESGQADPRVGSERSQAELGPPEQLGRDLRGIHRPNRWIDLLLALLPYYLLSPLITLLISAFYGPLSVWSPAEPHLYLGGRIAILAQVLLALVCRKRRSAELTLFWIAAALATKVSLMTREARFLPGRETIAGTWIESLLWYALLVGLLYWLARILGQRRFDRLLLTFAVLPLLLAAANYSTGQILLRGEVSHVSGFGQSFGLAGILAYQAAWAGGLALFFLLAQRDPRWLGVLLMVSYYAAPNLSEYQASLPIRLIWAGWLSLMILAWFWDWSERRIAIAHSSAASPGPLSGHPPRRN